MENTAEKGVAADDGGEDSHDKLVSRIGQLTRMLRDSMRELGLDKQVERAAEAIPDARDRLKYVANMTEQAAERALNAIEVAKPMQERMRTEAQELDGRWQTWYDSSLPLEEARALVADTRTFIGRVPDDAQATCSQLMEIMLAQDFQDLTGQVIKKIMEVVYNIEQQLLAVLLENISPERRAELIAVVSGVGLANNDSLMNGPQVNTEGDDVVANQDQVDDLLTSLGF
ncbi:protein phosphatase CheZ [Pararobbsia silviterrae]|uniref:Protein phosphatase CheZ n=1 Tax=Pararobbsia silviterrae TaxID=1792498 RepID=A0A494XCR8_9BURK|nr:protein phosphatase CheZ [Pararobbsia silviterrae]RKP45373.1 protein phosphatase CheZ [Pararobbsia silviterrae]